MTKNKLIYILPVFVAMLITSCSSGPTQDDNTITFWHSMGHEKTKTLQKVVEAFEKENPGKKIEQSSQGGTYEDLALKINRAIPAGTNPTMTFAYPDNVARYLDSNVVVNLDQFIDDEELGFKKEDGFHMDGDTEKIGKDDYIEGYWNEGTDYQKDGTYSAPFYKSTEVMFYNKKFFGGEYGNYKVPTTWEELVSVGNQIKADPKLEKLKLQAGFGYDSDSNLLISQAEQRGIPYTVKPTGDTNPYAFNNDQFIALTDELGGLIKSGVMATKATLPNSQYTSSLFAAEKLPITIGSTGGTSYNVSANFEVGVAAVPFSNNNAKYIQQGPSVCIFSNASKAQQELAWKFYKFATNSENGTKIALENNYDPARVSCHQTETYTNYIETSTSLFAKVCKVTNDYKDAYYTSPSFVGSDNARKNVGVIFSNMIHKNMTATQAVEAAYNECLISD